MSRLPSRPADASRPLPGRSRGLSPLIPGLLLLAAALACDSTAPPDEEQPLTPVFYDPDTFVMGADLSYVNQVLDHGGTYRDSAGTRSPYTIFADGGVNTVRLRLWHDPSWVRTEVYDDPSAPLYSGFEDVAAAIAAARAEGMEILLDFHYSDTWADPGNQHVPAAWQGIEDIGVLYDSVYDYTRRTLATLADRGLLPEMVQLGNEINCGILASAEPPMPPLDACAGFWGSQGSILNAAINAVRETAPGTRIVLHVAQPENVSWFFDHLTTDGFVTDFDVIGVSYYPGWSVVALESISQVVSHWRERYDRDVMVVETAYPWTMGGADAYANIMGAEFLVPGYPATPEGQRDFMIDLVQEVIDGGGSGVFYWEPAWITSGMRDLWGTGSSWENATLFDFAGDAHAGFELYTYPYDLDP